MTTTMVEETTLAPRVPFADFYDGLVWNQGEHTAFIGPTNSGKTTLATALLPKQPYVTVLATKPRDDTMTRLQQSEGYKVLRSWRKLSPQRYPRRIIWPPIQSLAPATLHNQRRRIHDALAAMYGEGGWCVYVDELWYLVNMLKLETDVRTYLLQARSLGISFTVATQRPAFVPLEVYDQSTHMYFWRDNDERNLQRLSGISWRSAQEVRTLIAYLEPHEFLYVHVNGKMLRSKAPRGGKR